MEYTNENLEHLETSVQQVMAQVMAERETRDLAKIADSQIARALYRKFNEFAFRGQFNCDVLTRAQRLDNERAYGEDVNACIGVLNKFVQVASMDVPTTTEIEEFCKNITNEPVRALTEEILNASLNAVEVRMGWIITPVDVSLYGPE